ncbi:Ser/Thr protein phosphatase, variant [Neurospora crassa OR74A]|uniref:Ser/Thr protein phosphatase, variant n=1 Tax=Neurospora crassa (strain ATCC 24698 / 74-OR23-1A / CBS 708.71 / DSM 1257 / FGSC 987) TaxID=367110 RepID=V5INT9_NEUCR|nr:Ser/Thr protein phosphatase, variant [Neurospora crassa OR74A]ESA43803.1 Ser/Thr protein phosphatase, variant [Neurospora crassa OR74A]|eukprot:XP_011392944.1 Ser/Thr protein phosphatase, variant [Neurospora crassa OR74A]
MMATEPSQPQALTTQDNGDRHHVPIISDLEVSDAVHTPVTLISNLSKKHLPSTTNPSPPSASSSDISKNKRLVIVGDTHGRPTALRSLLDKISFDNTTDHLILAGDLVTKGPDSKGLVQFARDIGASAVRGNHDDKVLEAAKWLGRIKQGKNGWGKTENQRDSVREDDEEMFEEEEAKDSVEISGRRRTKKPKGVKPEHIAVARSLTVSQLHWLASRPIILRVGHLYGAKTAPWNAKEVVVVHGGLIPSLPLEKQDPWAVMNVRSLVYKRSTSSTSDDNTGDEDEKKNDDGSIDTTVTHNRITTIPLDTREGEPWSRAWNRYQNLISSESNRVVVVYGHDARSGLQVDKHITIDPGKSPIPISARHITGTGDQTVIFTAEGDVEFEIETEYEGIDDDNDDDDDDDDNLEPGTISMTTNTMVTNAPMTAAAASPDTAAATETEIMEKRSPDGGKDLEVQSNRKKPKKFKGIRYAYGLDSGCGHGRKLSALVLGVNESGDDIVHWIEQVKCD